MLAGAVQWLCGNLKPNLGCKQVEAGCLPSSLSDVKGHHCVFLSTISSASNRARPTQRASVHMCCQAARDVMHSSSDPKSALQGCTGFQAVLPSMQNLLTARGCAAARRHHSASYTCCHMQQLYLKTCPTHINLSRERCVYAIHNA